MARMYAHPNVDIKDLSTRLELVYVGECEYILGKSRSFTCVVIKGEGG